MNKNERPAFLKGKGAAVGAVLCFVAVITMVGSYTYNHYKKDMERQIKDAQTTAEQLTEDDSTLANTDDILPTDIQKRIMQKTRNPKRMFSKRMKTVWRMEIHPQRKFKVRHLQIHRMCGLLRKVHLPGRQAEQHF